MRGTAFSDPDTLREMLALYMDGTISISAIARRYNCDHTTVIYHAQKAGIYRPRIKGKVTLKHLFIRETGRQHKEKIEREQITKAVNKHVKKIERHITKGKYDDLIADVNPGRSYREYMKEDRKRSVQDKVAKAKYMEHFIAEKKERDRLIKKGEMIPIHVTEEYRPFPS